DDHLLQGNPPQRPLIQRHPARVVHPHWRHPACATQRGSAVASRSGEGQVMGLTIYPGGASWSYGGFARFRERLATEEGIDLREMRGFGGSREWLTPNGVPITPLEPLLNHSDCDGHMESHECELVVPRLTAI